VTRPTLKKLLLSLVAIGVLGSITTGGTYAVFQNDEYNVNGATASGTLTLSNQVGVATTCFSQSSSGSVASGTENWNTKESSPASAGCDALFTTATLNYPGTLVQIHVTLKNTGSVDASKLYVFMPGASAGAGCVPSANVTVGAVLGGGNPCTLTPNGDLFYIEEDNSSWVAQKCQYPAGAGACAIGGGGTLNDFSTNYYKYAGAKLDLGSGLTNYPAMNAQDTRYFTIGIQEGNDNTLQGETATFSLTWHLDSN
jgi:hypothetical protein